MKRWPMRHFITVSQELREKRHLPLFVFGPKEAELQATHREEILAMGGLVYYSEDSRIQPLAGILRRCDLLVSNDSGIMHLGASAGCRVLAIFGPSVSRVWFPYSNSRNRVIERDVACRLGCRGGCTEHACLETILPEEVVSHAISLLETRPLHRVSPPGRSRGRVLRQFGPELQGGRQQCSSPVSAACEQGRHADR